MFFLTHSIITNEIFNLKYMIIDQLTHESIEDFTYELDTAIEFYIESLHDASKEYTISDGFQLNATIVSLVDSQNQQLTISSNGTLYPERGGTDHITLRLEIDEIEVARGYIEREYGDYEITDGGYANPTFADGFCISIKDVKSELIQYIDNSLEKVISLRDHLYRNEVKLS
ncbi:hypothetical protein GCM10023310_19730 [Paenibacillus vulneris]|uniref:DUF1828 domain-containing protein n=1 Tax=Paenibacillus vulneris TaxID=1133364 RepID=A0ABW3UN62_9BACL